MTDDEGPAIENVSKVEGHSIITIPADKADAVLEFLVSLRRDDADVSGYMLSSGLFGGISVGRLAATQETETQCVQTKIVNETDFRCIDTDTLTT
ncbi:MAG: hypothetical protein WBW04_21150 [Nitrolancea sp.]